MHFFYFKCRKRIWLLSNDKTFSGYERLLKTLVPIARFTSNTYMQMALEHLYLAYFQFVNRPRSFDDTKLLVEVDRLHTELFEQFPQHFTESKNGWIDFATEDYK